MELLQRRGFSYAAARKWLQRHDPKRGAHGTAPVQAAAASAGTGTLTVAAAPMTHGLRPGGLVSFVRPNRTCLSQLTAALSACNRCS